MNDRRIRTLWFYIMIISAFPGKRGALFGKGTSSYLYAETDYYTFKTHKKKFIGRKNNLCTNGKGLVKYFDS